MRIALLWFAIILPAGPTVEIMPAWRASAWTDCIRCLRGPGQQTPQFIDVTVYGFLRSIRRLGNRLTVEVCGSDPFQVRHFTCRDYDYDRDGDVDLRDFAVYQITEAP